MSDYSKFSPYYYTKISGSYLDVIAFRNIPGQVDDVEFEILPQYEHRPDLLAYDLYGNEALWWVFAVRNKDKIKDPIFDLYAGQTIFLPKKTTLDKIMGS